MIVNPLLQMTVDKLQDDMVKYFDTLQPYLELIKDLRFETFIKYTVDKTYPNHDLTRQIIWKLDESISKDKEKHEWNLV